MNQPNQYGCLWTDDHHGKWWYRMGEVFGKNWFEINGPEMPQLWKESLALMSFHRAKKIIDHYATSGDTFPPNLSQVNAIARSLKVPEDMEHDRIAKEARLEESKNRAVLPAPEETKRVRYKGNAFLPGESLGDYLAAQRKSGMSPDEFVKHRTRVEEA